MAPTKPSLPAVEPVYNPSRPFPSLSPLYQHTLPNCPGKTLVGLKVDFAPDGSTPPHTHAGAFVAVHVLFGHVFNKMNDDPIKVFGPGESWFENPGCRHRISDNASMTEPATIVATMIVDSKVVEEGGIQALVVIDEEYREVVKEAMERATVAAGGKI